MSGSKEDIVTHTHLCIYTYVCVYKQIYTIRNAELNLLKDVKLATIL